MKLRDTIKLMISKNYKDRFIAEYLQLKIRIDSLTQMLLNWDKLDFTPTCDKRTLRSQLASMQKYLTVLDKRAVIEGISFVSIEPDVSYEEFVDNCLEEYKEKNIDWWTFEDFKSFLKNRLEIKYGKDFDFRSVDGREILHYARDKWECE